MRRSLGWQVLFLAKRLSQFNRILTFQKKTPVALSFVPRSVNTSFRNAEERFRHAERPVPDAGQRPRHPERQSRDAETRVRDPEQRVLDPERPPREAEMRVRDPEH